MKEDTALAVAIAIFLAAVLLAGQGCTPPVVRACVHNRCFIQATPEQVDRHCRKRTRTWDSGAAVKPGDGKRVRCCTLLRKGRRYRIWMSRGEESCVAHEECHISVFERDRHEYVGDDHKICHGFGLDKDKPRRYAP